jgi:hypothetical protein
MNLQKIYAAREDLPSNIKDIVAGLKPADTDILELDENDGIVKYVNFWYIGVEGDTYTIKEWVDIPAKENTFDMFDGVIS